MKNTARKTAKSGKTSAPMVKTTKVNKMPPVSHDAIAARAFELYLARNGAPGNADADWLRAEADLNGR